MAPQTQDAQLETNPEEHSWADGAATLAAITYPFAMYAALRFGAPRVAALGLLVLIVPLAVMRLRRWNTAEVRGIAGVPVLTAALLLVSAVLNSKGLVLIIPSVINVVLLVAFAGTLWSSRPMVERFARLQDADLSPDEVTWCRLWTWLWIVFFGLNASIAGVLAAREALDAWAVYNGGIAYALMGAMFTVEFVVRKFRFGGTSDSWAGRWLQRFGAPKERR